MNSLTAGNDARPAASHEAKLGIAVISILVFAFGFLVYHKMDLFQRQLTGAAIPSTAAAAVTSANNAEQPLNASTALANRSETGVAIDPLLSVNDLSDGSPFSEFGTKLDEPSNSSESAPDRIAHFGVGQDAVSGADPAPESESDMPVFAFSEPIELNTNENSAGTTGEHESAPGSNGGGQEQDVAGQPESEIRIGTLDATPDSLADSGRTPAASQDTEVTFLQTESDPATSERILVAMAAPQQEAGFSGGFIADDNGVSARNSIVSDVVESMPVLDPANTEPREETLLAAQESTPFGSGFEAVTQPSTRSANRNSIKTAAGSGSDGKFSLAAFNYQNNSAEPAPDDGSTFDSTVVQDGDNYTRISKRIYGSGRYFSALAVFNQHRIPEPKKMRPGMVVLTPPVPVLEERYPQLFMDSKAKTVEPAAFLIMDDGLPAYRVGERETLSKISERFLGRSARWIEIYRLNQSTVKDPNKLKAGLILTLPADATEVNVTP